MSRRGTNRQVKLENHPAISCWFCEVPHPLLTMIRDGILISREERAGGPYHLFTCPYCLRESIIEETPRGRWFGSPSVKLGLLDYLFPPADGGGREGDSESVLKAISWFRENEERRRYFFERDGDPRYRGSHFLKILWPWGREESPRRQRRSDPGAEERPRSRRPGREAPGTGAGAGPREKRETGERRGEEPRRPRILTPHEILGIDPGASVEEIQKRFHRLAVQYHPDKVHHRGEEFRRQAHRKFVELQEAYTTLLRRREREDG